MVAPVGLEPTLSLREMPFKGTAYTIPPRGLVDFIICNSTPKVKKFYFQIQTQNLFSLASP